MRIKSVYINGIGGLADGRVDLPNRPVVAIAGANGTGKSKLLACLLAPWTLAPPTARDGINSEIGVTFELDEIERGSIANLSLESGWGSVEVSPEVVVGCRMSIAGTSSLSEPPIAVLQNFFRNETLMKVRRSLNVVYLPAERRLLPSQTSGIDLDQLSDAASYQRTNESRSAAQNFGRLDDQEFERFAAALSIADQLEDDEEQAPGAAATDTPLPRISWEDFSTTVNDLIYPKKLLPLSKNFPEKLRIRTPTGETHYVPDLSSGERQALIIISRVLRAGAGHSVVIIDEPDAYLHPQLSERLISALSRAVGENGQLIVATHSPAILDNLPLESILRVTHGGPVRKVGQESDRISLYRDTGFRASALTQSDLLLYTEGDSDGVLLRGLYPKLAKASITVGGGRTGVINRITTLAGDSLPVLGVVDRDIAPPIISDPEVASRIIVWPTADIEGVFLSDDAALAVMIDRKLVKEEYRDLTVLRGKIKDFYRTFEDSVIAEAAKNELRKTNALKWPNSRASNPIAGLEHFCTSIAAPTRDAIDAALEVGRDLWDLHSETPWVVVRGKYVIGTFNDQCGTMRKYSTLLEAITAERPSLASFSEFETRLNIFF